MPRELYTMLNRMQELNSPIANLFLAYKSEPPRANSQPALAVLRLRDQLAQHIRQNAAVLVVVNFDGRINAAADGDVFHRAVLARDLHRQILLRLDVRVEADDVVSLRAV